MQLVFEVLKQVLHVTKLSLVTDQRVQLLFQVVIVFLKGLDPRLERLETLVLLPIELHMDGVLARLVIFVLQGVDLLLLVTYNYIPFFLDVLKFLLQFLFLLGRELDLCLHLSDAVDATGDHFLTT